MKRVSVGELMDEISELKSEIASWKVKRKQASAAIDLSGSRSRSRYASLYDADERALEEARDKISRLYDDLSPKRRQLAKFEAIHALGSPDPSIPARDMDIIEELSADKINPRTGIGSRRWNLGGFWHHLRAVPKGAAKALATGVAAKLMLGGVAKAAGAPGVTEAMEIAGREQHTPTEFIRSEADSIAEMLGLATGYQGREPRYDARREAAIRATMRSGREGLRPAPGETPITPEEVEAYQRRRR